MGKVSTQKLSFSILFRYQTISNYPILGMILSQSHKYWIAGFESPDVRHWIESMDFRIEMKHLKHVETNGALECMSGSMKLLCIMMYLYISFM